MATMTRVGADLTVDDLLDSVDVEVAARRHPNPSRTPNLVERLHSGLEQAGRAYLRGVDLSAQCQPGDQRRDPSVRAVCDQAVIAAKFLMEVAGLTELRLDPEGDGATAPRARRRMRR